MLEPEEAELAKLFTNTWRYIKFAAANQFYMIANDFGLDFERIRPAVTHDYPRAADMPGAGFAAGPCLFKDTMQLAAFNNNNFALGHAAMLVNEGLPLYLVASSRSGTTCATMTVGILGMAFKGELRRHPLEPGYKLRRSWLQGREVLVHRPVRAPSTPTSLLRSTRSLEEPTSSSSPRRTASTASCDVDKPVVDIWNLLGEGVGV